MNEQRPNPERLLERAQNEERNEKRGRLKIYLGAAPGVGKTYTMLEDAQEKRLQGLDVLVGVVETHGRKEIDRLLKTFEVLPRQNVTYHDQVFAEFDLDAVLKRDPGLVLIDELAHTNVPGLRHAKRWQDVKEILDRGIDVYTTLNVQHVESLNNIVSQIINTPIKETVPDSMIEMADTIELVDLPPEDLLKRLQQGKVYFPKQAELAAENFFRKGNLIALRELALRVTAQSVNTQVLLYRQGLGIKYIWPTKEKILVCVGATPNSAKIIRSARRFANKLEAEWIAVYVDRPNLTLSDDERNNAIQHLQLAEQLGAQTRIINGLDIVKEVMNFAREQNVTQIVIGKPSKTRWRDYFFSSLADELVHQSQEIDVYFITDESNQFESPKPDVAPVASDWGSYWIATGVVAFVTVLNLLLNAYLEESNIIMIYLLGTMMVALLGRRGPSVYAALLSVLAYDFFFMPESFSFSITHVPYIITLFVMLLVALIISQLTIVSRKQAEIAHYAAYHTASLHTLSRQLASARGVDKLLGLAVRYIGEAFNSDVLALIPENKQLKIRVAFGEEQSLNPKELAVAQWVYDLGQTAGLGTDTLPFSDAIYLPLLTSQGTIGVLRIKPVKKKYLFSPEQRQLLEASANQIALAIEVDRIQEQAKKSELKTETDRVRSALLESVSHDLRTPLISIIVSGSTLMEMSRELEANQIKELGSTIYFEAEQLSRLINNILQISYFEADTMKLQKEPNSLEEVINVVIKTSSKKLDKKPVHVKLPSRLPLIPFDATLIQEVLVNLLDNAIKFTPTASPIEVSVAIQEQYALISVEDEGPGIMFDEVDKLFEKFYRGRMLTSERGLGLGLAICYQIIKAHDGQIWAQNRDKGGAAFRFTLPLSLYKF